MFQIAEKVKAEGGEAVTACSYTKSRNIRFPENHYQIGGIADKFAHIELAKLTGKHGCFSIGATRRLVKRIREFNPDVIHLHNLHGWYLNIKILFNFLEKYNKPVVWTLHDCWAFTGHCPFYSLSGCRKWISGCKDCSSYRDYPSSKRDDSQYQYDYKKQNFTKLEKVTIVTPSKWLADEVKNSYLKKYNVVVINNGIDASVFKPTSSNFRAKYGIGEKVILLGVAFDWGIRKGLPSFLKLAEDLDTKYQVVLVGLSEEQMKTLPSNIIGIRNTSSQEELASIYSASDYLVNPTLEDNLPTVIMESLACGTPVITYDTGGCKEMISDDCGQVVARNDYNALLLTVSNLERKTKRMSDACIKHSLQFIKDEKYQEYIGLFKRITKNNENGVR